MVNIPYMDPVGNTCCFCSRFFAMFSHSICLLPSHPATRDVSWKSIVKKMNELQLDLKFSTQWVNLPFQPRISGEWCFQRWSLIFFWAATFFFKRAPPLFWGVEKSQLQTLILESEKLLSPNKGGLSKRRWFQWLLNWNHKSNTIIYIDKYLQCTFTYLSNGTLEDVGIGDTNTYTQIHHGAEVFLPLKAFTLCWPRYLRRNDGSRNRKTDPVLHDDVDRNNA